MKFKIGDRVQMREDNSTVPINTKGTVLGHLAQLDVLKVVWDEDVRGHTCNGRCEDGHGWNVPQENVRKIKLKENKGWFM